jgi:hypothetical protein
LQTDLCAFRQSPGVEHLPDTQALRKLDNGHETKPLRFLSYRIFGTTKAVEGKAFLPFNALLISAE